MDKCYDIFPPVFDKLLIVGYGSACPVRFLYCLHLWIKNYKYDDLIKIKSNDRIFNVRLDTSFHSNSFDQFLYLSISDQHRQTLSKPKFTALLCHLKNTYAFKLWGKHSFLEQTNAQMCQSRKVGNGHQLRMFDSNWPDCSCPLIYPTLFKQLKIQIRLYNFCALENYFRKYYKIT